MGSSLRMFAWLGSLSTTAACRCTAARPLVELGQAALEVGQPALELGGGLRLDARDLLLEARDGRMELGGIRFESREVLLHLRAERARLRLGERCSRGLDLALDRRQALLELRRVLLDEALDLGDRRGVDAQASGKVGDEAPVFEGDDAALRRDELALVLDQVDEPLLRPIDRGGNEALNLRRGERRLRHVGSELSRRRRDRSGERLGGRRQLLLDLGLDVDVGVELVDREDAELLLDVLVLEDLFGLIGELAAVEDLGLNPVRDHRDEQHHRREHDEGPHERAVTMLRLLRRAILRGLAPGGLGRGCRGRRRRRVVHWTRTRIAAESLTIPWTPRRPIRVKTDPRSLA